MATTTGIKFYSQALGARDALSLSQSSQGSIVFDKTSKAIYVNGVKYGGSNVADATFADNVLTISRVSGGDVELNFSTLATTASVMDAFNEIKNYLTMDDGAGTYVAQADESYVSSATLTNVNTTNLIDTTGSDADMVDVAVAKVDKKAKAILNEVIDVKKTIETLSDNVVTDVDINGTSIVDSSDGEVHISVDGTYDDSTNKIATQSTVSDAIDGLESTATIASVSSDVVTLKAGLVETDGIVTNNSNADIVLAKVAKTGTAADVAVVDANGKLDATDVESALEELAGAIADNEVSVAANEKIISMLNSNELSTTLTVAIEKKGEVGSQKDYIVLKGINGAEISSVDASSFVVDGMLDSAELVTTTESGVSVQTPYIKLTFNTDSGKQPIRFSVSSLVDTYTSGDTNTLTVSNYTITPVTAAVAENGTALTTGGQVYTAIAATKGQDIQTITGETATTQGNYINVKVSATKGQNDDNYTLSTTSNVTTQAVSTADSSHMGLAEASDVKSYVDTKVGTAIQSVDGSTTEKAKSVTQSDYATVKVSATTDASNKVTLDSAVGLTVQAVGTADSTHMGLAEASNVRAYVDAHTASVTNSDATIPVNSATATTLATVDNTDITAKVSFTWEEYS